MSDYARAGGGGATHFTAKDALTTGDANKVIVGAQLDAEFNAILTAIADKIDGEYATQAQAEAGTSSTTTMSPLRTEQWADTWKAENGGMLGDVHALADPGADTVLGWDDSASAAIGFTLHASLLHAATELSVDHDAATNFVSDEHVAHAGVDIIAGTGLTGGGTIDASRTLNGVGGNGITANANDIAITNQAVSATVPVGLTTGSLVWDSSSITELAGSSVSQSADGYLVDDAGVLKVVPYDQNAVLVKAGETTGTLAFADANTIMEFNGTATLTIPANASVAFELGTIILLCVDHATQVLTVTAGAGVTLNSIWHPGGTATASDTVVAGGTASLIKIATDEWMLNGNTTT